MNLQPINQMETSWTNKSSYIPSTDDELNAQKGLLNRKRTLNSETAQAALISEKYSSEKLLVHYTNKDGDTLTLSAESIDYQQAILSANEDASGEGWKKIIENIKDEYSKMKQDLINRLFGTSTDEKENSVRAQDPKAFDEIKEIPGLPEYWNAENTAQRIVDFATSFLSVFKGSKEEYLSLVKDAIEQGFSQAKDILGNMPDAVGKLVNKTHAMVMEKLDKWAESQGISLDKTQDSGQKVSPVGA